jgi:uncharacterized protein YyaL (SSP411 family)
MLSRWRIGGGVAMVALAASIAAAWSGAGAGAIRGHASAFWLATAQQGLAEVQAHWWDAGAGWYYDTFNQQPPNMPLARLWDAYPLFETEIAVAVAQPSPANTAALKSFASAAASLYWNPNVTPYGGYGWYPNQHDAGARLYFDDSGWWGLSFIGAYRATGDPSFLFDARRAFRFIVGSGWNRKQGGTFWETGNNYITIEPLAAAVLIGTRLYQVQRRASELRWVLKLLDWANAHSFNRRVGLYQRNTTDPKVMDYAQGLMITANWELCRTLRRQVLCAKARTLANAAWRYFPRALNWAPEYDVVYLRWMLEYGQESGDPRWYQLAAANAERALKARNESGYYLNDWNGKPLADGLIEQAANLELFARLAAAPQPTS